MNDWFIDTRTTMVPIAAIRNLKPCNCYMIYHLWFIEKMISENDFFQNSNRIKTNTLIPQAFMGIQPLYTVMVKTTDDLWNAYDMAVSKQWIAIQCGNHVGIKFNRLYMHGKPVWRKHFKGILIKTTKWTSDTAGSLVNTSVQLKTSKLESQNYRKVFLK